MNRIGRGKAAKGSRDVDGEEKAVVEERSGAVESFEHQVHDVLVHYVARRAVVVRGFSVAVQQYHYVEVDLLEFCELQVDLPV